MAKKIPSRIGSVKIINLGQDNREYSDAAEPALLKIFSSSNPSIEREKALNSNPSWPLYYHLSDSRRNVVSWINFKKGARVLEVGAGCGSITEELVSKDVSVVANDISWKRSEINAHRNSTAKNLEIVVGNLETYKPKEKFDYVVCVGVLEYAGSFISGKNPYSSFISYMKTFLKPDGVLILAIENKLGFKYLAGAKEDHTGRLFDGLNDYTTATKKVKTFGKNELSDLLLGSFTNNKFFYPYPDYKLPQILFSDELYPGENYYFPLSILPTPNPDQRRFSLYNEKTFVNTLQKNKLYRDFSNSFIVLASNGDIENQVSLSFFQNHRTTKNRLTTTIQKNEDDSMRVVKSASMENSELIDNIVKAHSVIGLAFGNKINLPVPRKTSSASIEIDYVYGKSLEYLFAEALIAKNVDEVESILKKYIEKISSMNSKPINPSKQEEFLKVFGDSYNETTPCVVSSIDMNFDNFIIDSNQEWSFFDYEWTYEFAVPINYIIGRTIFWELLCRYADLVEILSEDNHVMVENIRIPKQIYNLLEAYLSSDNLNKIMQTEKHFQEHTIGRKVNLRSLINRNNNILDIESLVDKQDFFEYNSKLLETYPKILAQKDAELSSLHDEIQAIKSSKGYRLIERARKIKKF